MPGRVFRRGSRWWIAYHDGRGREYRESGGHTEAQASAKLKRRVKELAGGRFIGPAEEKTTVGELLDDLITHLQTKGVRSLDKIQSHVKAVRAYFEHRLAIDVTTPLVERFIATRLQDGRARATVNRELECQKQAFILASRRTPPRVIRVPYIPLLKVENARQGFLSRADVESILAGLPDDDLRDFVAWGFWTGMRHGEIGKLTWGMFDRETWTLRLHANAAKTGRGRTLSLEGPLRAIIERRLRARRFDSLLIFHRTSKGVQGAPVGDFRKSWAAACRQIGLVPGRRGGITFHDLRRSAIRNMVRAGVDPAIAMKVSGHRTRSVFDRYNIVSEDDLRDAMAKTAHYVSTLPVGRNLVPLVTPENPDKIRTITPRNSYLLGNLAEAGGNRTHRSGGQPGAKRL
jgi:integrase